MENTKPLVSIALCTYNGEKYLREQLDSLVTQDYPNLEIIAVDDKSTDATIDILNEYSAVNSNLKVFINDTNLGYKKNFEKAIQLCDGEYIALSDQDDIWELGKISMLITEIKDSLLIYHDSLLVDLNGKSLNKRISDVVNMHSVHPEAFLFFNCVSAHASLFHYTLKNYLFPFPVQGNHDAWIAYVAANVGRILFLNKCLVYYRQHQTSSTDILKRKGLSIRQTKYKRFQNELEFIEHCSSFSRNKNQERMNLLSLLYKRREGGKFNIELFLFLITNRDVFFPVYKRGALNIINFSFKHSKGVLKV